MSIAEFVLVSGNFMGESAETPKRWKWRSFTKVTIPIPIHCNSSYDKFIVSVMQRGDLDCVPNDVVISYLMHSREKVNPTIINSDVHVLTYIMDVNTDRFRPILRINIIERSFGGPLNSSAPPSQRSTVDDNLIDNDLNNYEKVVIIQLIWKMILCIWKTFHRPRKMMMKTVERHHNQDTPSPMKLNFTVVKHSSIRKS
ncbi:hypothetical protein P3S68_031013 [Capsicum galapagoense]